MIFEIFKLFLKLVFHVFSILDGYILIIKNNVI